MRTGDLFFLIFDKKGARLPILKKVNKLPFLLPSFGQIEIKFKITKFLIKISVQFPTSQSCLVD